MTGQVSESAVFAHGEIVPPQPDLFTWVTVWALDPFILFAVILATVAYASGVRALSRRGDSWPVGRSVAFGAGLALIVIASMSSLAVYDTTLFSVHAVQHMVLQMLAPVPLAMSAPVTLALRTLPLRPRKVLLRALHSRVAKLVCNPLVGLAGFIATPTALYNSGLYGLTVESELLHGLSHAHFLLLGCLFFWPLLGVDPLPGRMLYPARVLLVFLVLPLHVLLGISIMQSTDVYAAEHYAQLARDWGASPLSDQRTGGAIMWAFGDIVGMMFLTPLLLQWIRADEREAAREDRRLDRLDARAAAAATSPVSLLEAPDDSAALRS